MNIVLRQARIIDPSSSHHLQQADVFVQNGIIHFIGNHYEGSFDREIKSKDLCISPGWVDVFAHFCDPGTEYKETLATGAQAAAAGGFTDVLIVPNTQPVVHNKSGVEYIVQRSKTLPATLHPVGAISKNTEGKELAEMYDMHQSGAVAFSDGLAALQSPGMVMKALQYVQAVDATLIQLPDDKSLAGNGLMNEGVVSTLLGLAGKPAIAEELMISRDCELARYTGSKIHFTGISTANSVAIIRKAKSEGLPISCSVTPYHLCFCEDDLNTYDTNLKVNPPLRTKEDKKALQEAVLDGTIDCIATHHLPQNRDEKEVEFEHAGNGMIGLETAFGVVKTCLPHITDERLVSLFSTNARKIFGLSFSSINEGSIAVISLFSNTEKWQVDEKSFYSKSKNSPFIGWQLTGRALGIINKDKVFLNEEN